MTLMKPVNLKKIYVYFKILYFKFKFYCIIQAVKFSYILN